jgi:hypothetical protein
MEDIAARFHAAGIRFAHPRRMVNVLESAVPIA